MKLLKYTILALTLLNIPMVFFFYVNQSLGGILSYATYGLLLAYFVLNNGGKPNFWMLLIGLTYFLISGLSFHSGTESSYFIFLIKYIIIIFAGSVLVKKISVTELFIFMAIGGLSTIVEATLFADKYGRYGGLYINANMGGFIAIFAYTLTFKIKNFYKKSLAQILITIGGIVTFSRTFIVIWVLVNLISVKISIKNVRILAAGFGLMLLLTIFGSLFKLNTTRLKQFSAVINQEEGSLQEANEASRTETWAIYYPYIADKPLLGNGYNSFQSTGLHNVSVHNAYLLILGESGIVPFALFLGLNLYFVFMGYRLFRKNPLLIMQGLAFALFMLTFHNFFTMDVVIILALWMCHQIKLAKSTSLEEIENNPDQTYLSI